MEWFTLLGVIVYFLFYLPRFTITVLGTLAFGVGWGVGWAACVFVLGLLWILITTLDRVEKEAFRDA